MDLADHLWLMLVGGEYHLAPLEAPQKILDLGTGTGTGLWAISMADKYPSAQVLGIDLSPVQPQWVPPNCEFQIDDFNQEWTWMDNFFDMIHRRLLRASVSDYPKLFRRAFSAVEPGGYFEIHDTDPGFYVDDNTLPENSKAVEWDVRFKEACARAGKRILAIEECKKLIEDADSENIRKVKKERPQDMWPKKKSLKCIGM